MAKRSNLEFDYQQSADAIRKAKGNPNKNIHQKKNGSDYHIRERQQEEAITKAENAPLVMPHGMKIFLICTAVVWLVISLLTYTVFKGNEVMLHLTYAVSGIACMIVYVCRHFITDADNGFFKAMSLIVLFLGAYLGIPGLYHLILDIF